MKRLLALLLACALLLSCVSLALAEDKKTLTVWIPQYQFSKDENAISDQDFWDGVFEEIDDPEELREVLKKMERNGSFHIVWGENGIPAEVWVG